MPAFKPEPPTLTWRWVWRIGASAVVVYLALLALIAAPVWGLRLAYDVAAHPPKAQVQATLEEPGGDTGATTISIPKIGVFAPVVFEAGRNETDILRDLRSGVVHYAGTANFGENGNAAVFGHSSEDWWSPGDYKFIFVLLDKLVAGDTVVVQENGKKYEYQVTGTQVVAPTDVAVLDPTPDATLSLITCTPAGTALKRLVVRAKLVSPAQPVASPLASSAPTASASMPTPIGTAAATSSPPPPPQSLTGAPSVSSGLLGWIGRLFSW